MIFMPKDILNIFQIGLGDAHRWQCASDGCRLAEPTEICKTTRDAVERVASDKYDRTARRPYEIVTITADDVDGL
jgi:hypothetical protein